MSPERSRFLRLLRAGWDLLWLEVKVVTGNRAILLGALQAVTFVGLGLWVRFGPNSWQAASLHTLLVLLPGLVPAVVLGMVVVMGESEGRLLEVTFSGPGGRHLVWSFRLAAVVAFLGLSACALALAAKGAIDHGFPALASALHATVSLAFVALLVTFLTVLFRGQAVSGFIVVALLVVTRLFLQGRGTRYDPLMNPLNPPDSLDDPATWFRAVVFNRALFVVLAGLCVAGTLSLLQRRERLL